MLFGLTRSGIQGYHPCCSPFSFHQCFFHSLFTRHWISFVFFFFTTDLSVPILSTLHLLMMSFLAWDWLWYPMLWSQRRSMGCTSHLKCLTWLGFEPRTSQSSGSERYN